MIFSFDIDGTLIDHNKLLFESYREAIRTTYGKVISNMPKELVGNTDYQNLLILGSVAGVSDIELTNTIKYLSTTFIRIYISKFESIKWTECKNAKYTVDYLLNQKKYKVGIHSGGYKKTSINKLKIFNYEISKFSFLFFGDKKSNRSEVLNGINTRFPVSQEVYIVGDTPQDIISAKENGFKSIAVSTGKFTYGTLLKEKPDLCIHNLKELITMLDL